MPADCGQYNWSAWRTHMNDAAKSLYDIGKAYVILRPADRAEYCYCNCMKILLVF